MKRWVFILPVLFVSPTIAGDAPNYHAVDEMQERANSYVAALEAQRNDALNQVVQLKAELDKVKKEKNCGK
jgi:hypothetical protein